MTEYDVTDCLYSVKFIYNSRIPLTKKSESDIFFIEELALAKVEC